MYVAAGSGVLSSTVVRSQLHSTLPSGTFVLDYTSSTNPGQLQTVTSVSVPYNVNSREMQSIFQETISTDINVSSTILFYLKLFIFWEDYSYSIFFPGVCFNDSEPEYFYMGHNLYKPSGTCTLASNERL